MAPSSEGLRSCCSSRCPSSTVSRLPRTLTSPSTASGHPGNSGGRQAGEDLTHDPCRGRADNLTDAKDDGVERGGVSHLY